MEQHDGYTKLTVEAFLPVGEKLIQEQKDFVAIFSGSEDAQGANWCSDCVEAKPHILKSLVPAAKSKNVPVFYVAVGDRPTWKNPQHPLRIHPIYKVDCVPTGLFVKEGRADNRLREGDFLLDDLIQEFLE